MVIFGIFRICLKVLGEMLVMEFSCQYVCRKRCVSKSSLDYQISVGYQINIALEFFQEIDERSL